MRRFLSKTSISSLLSFVTTGLITGLMTAIFPGMVLLASPAAAQDWQHYSDDRGHGAFVCPNGSHPSGQRACFELYCKAKGSPIEWHVTLSGYTLDHGPQPLIVQVDGANRAALLMVQHINDHAIDLRLPFDAGEHEHLLHTLARGAAGLLYIGVGDNQLALPMSLKGSAKALSQVQPLCAADGHQTIIIPDHKPEVRADYILSAVEVRDTLLGRELMWENEGGQAFTTYHANGEYDGKMKVDGKDRSNNGSWWLIDNGNVCWKGGRATGCFQFRHEGGAVHAYRVDGGVDLHLGRVMIGK